MLRRASGGYPEGFKGNSNSVLALNAGVTIAGISLVALLPKMMADQREGG
jgi:hypothetical protein